jgi:hypothetical protein
VRVGCRRPVQSRAVGKPVAHLGVETGGIIEHEMELLRSPGREAAAAPTAAASFQELSRLALSAANRAVPGAAAGPSCARLAGHAAQSSYQSQCALRDAMRARSSPGCRGLGPALRDVQTPTLPVGDRQPQREMPPKLRFPTTIGTDGAGWARQRHLEPLQCTRWRHYWPSGLGSALQHLGILEGKGLQHRHLRR